MMAAPRGDERLRAMGTSGFREPAVDFKDGKSVGTRQLYTDGRFGTKTGKATLFQTKWPGFPETVARQRQKYPFWVNTGRANNVWQTLYPNLRQQFVMDRFSASSRATSWGSSTTTGT
jgi:arsenite oxidase large subunit